MFGIYDNKKSMLSQVEIEVGHKWIDKKIKNINIKDGLK